MDSAAESKRIDRVALACIQCRGRHVKCDATQPICNRCKRDGKECTYQKSRRGGLDKAALARRRLRLQREAESAQQDLHDENYSLEIDTYQDSTDSSPKGDKSQLDQYSPDPEFNAIHVIETDLAQSNAIGFQINGDRLIDFFYENFFPSFPITLPLHYLNQRRLTFNHGMDNLILVLQWIGSIYAPWAPSDPYYQAAFQGLSVLTFLRTPFNVQALLLFAAAQHHYDLKLESRKTLDMAVTLALELRMNEQAFAQAYGEANPVLEESWRRTYYFLHIVDQHFAIVTGSPMFLMRDVPNLVDLPCDDVYYEAGKIPPVVSWKVYEDREFEDVEVIYSSIAYLWDIQTIVTYIMRTVVETGSFSDNMIAAVDAKIAAWQSLLPACKKDPMGPNGKVDEVIFMAHMSAAVVMMTIHRPFSSLTYSVEELSTESFVTPVPFIEPGKAGRSTHTARALKAVEMSTKLLAIPCAVEKHNVFTMCISAELATAQISACNTLLEDHALAIARDRVRLSIGFLKTMGTIWPLAKRMAKDVRMVARATLSGVQSRDTIQLQADPAAAIEIPRDEIIWPIDPCAQIDIYSGIVLPTTWDASMVGGYSSSTGSSNT